jgi:hypothetical protein
METMDYMGVVQGVTEAEWERLAQELCETAHSDATHYTTAFLVCDGQGVRVAEPDGLGEGPVLVLAFVEWSPGDEDWLDLKVSRWWLDNLGAQHGGFGHALRLASDKYVPVTDDAERAFGGNRAGDWRGRDGW